MSIPDVLMNWKLVLMLVIGSVSFFNGIRIWVRGFTTVDDPFLWGPLTGGIGCFTADFFFDDEEIRGFPARMLAVFQTLFGVVFLSLFFFLGVWPAYFSKASQSAEAANPSSGMVSILTQGPGAPTAPDTPQAPSPAPNNSGVIEHGAKVPLPEGVQRR
ncbi:MAG: hypothetical protein EOP83_34670 [Verrucomicrobiaceae bacterium]|nr:MAG: hypothetical protein EOP83_34670 [Verrucomicrobiaceae bacterium]